MKLSNKILIGFFGLVLTYMLAAFTEVRLRGESSHFTSENAIVENIALAEVGFIVVPDLDKKVTITTDEEPRIRLRSIKGDLSKHVSYSMKGDTLVFERLTVPEDTRYELHVFVQSGQVRGIDATYSSLEVGDLGRATLDVTQKGGVLVMGGNFSMDTMNLQASRGAQFDTWNSQVDVLALDMNSANVEIRGVVGRLEGEMINESYLSVGSAREFAFRKDGTSRLNYRN